MIVAPNIRRSVVASANYLARNYHINAGMPLLKAYERCSHIKVVYSGHQHYYAFSQYFFALVRGFVNGPIRPCSIDECECDVSKDVQSFYELEQYAQKLQRYLWIKLHLPTSIGCSFNPYFAKIAANLKKPFGISVINFDNFNALVYPLSITQLIGIGPKTTLKFANLKLYQVLDIISFNVSKNLIQNQQTMQYILEHQQLLKKRQSYGVSRLETYPKTISESITFPYDTNIIANLLVTIEQLIKNIHQRVETLNIKIKQIQLQIRYQDFRTVQHQIQLLEHTNIYSQILENVKDLFDKHYESPKLIRLIRISVANFKTHKLPSSVIERQVKKLLITINSEHKTTSTTLQLYYNSYYPRQN